MPKEETARRLRGVCRSEPEVRPGIAPWCRPLQPLIGGELSISSISQRGRAPGLAARLPPPGSSAPLATPWTSTVSRCSSWRLSSPIPPQQSQGPSHIPAGLGRGGRDRNPRVPRNPPAPRPAGSGTAAVAARQPPRRLVSCTAGKAGPAARWAGRAWGARAPLGAPCSAPRAGAASLPPLKLLQVTSPAWTPWKKKTEVRTTVPATPLDGVCVVDHLGLVAGGLDSGENSKLCLLAGCS